MDIFDCDIPCDFHSYFKSSNPKQLVKVELKKKKKKVWSAKKISPFISI